MRPVKYFLMALVATMVMSVFANADFNQRLNYQGRLVDSDGVPVSDGNKQVTFEICTDAACTAVVWTEIHASEPFVDGMFSAILGGTTALSTVNFESATYYLRVSIAGTPYTPTQQLTATAMALNIRNDTITSAKVVDDTLTAADLNVNVVSSVDGVTNDGGNIDLVAGAGISITPDDGANTITIAAVSSGIDHGALLGLGDDDHTQYFHLSQNETVAGIPAFNGGTTGSAAPFSVDSTFLVTNLNADLLDGQTGSYYQDASNINAGTLGTGYYSAYADLSAEGYLGNAAGDLALNNGTLQATLNADKLDSLDSLSFLRSDASDDFTGTLLQLRANGDLAVSDGYICVDDNGAAAGACLGSTDGAVYADDFICNGGACIDAAELNDGALSGLDADLLDGQHGAYYQNASNINAGTLGTGYYSAYSDLSAEGYLGNAAGDLALNNGTVQATLNADQLDSLDSLSFLRSDTSDDFTGALLQLRTNGDFAVSDGYICVDDNAGAAGACLGAVDGVVYADDFICNVAGCISDTDIADIYVRTAGDDMSGGLTMSQDAADVLNFTANSANDSRGIAFNARTALTADFNDGYLRLNNASEFTNGVYTPGVFRADGGYNVDGATVVDAAGQYFYTASTSINKFGAVNASGFGLDALNSGDWDLLVYENQTYTSNLLLGYNGTSILAAYDTNETLTIRANGTGNLNLMDSGTGNIVAYRPIDMVRGDTGYIHSLGRISFDWTTGTYDDSSYHGIESENEAGALADSLRINSYSDIINTIDSNANSTSYFKVQKESTTNGTDLLTLDESGNLWVAGDLSAAAYTTLDARYLNASGGDTGSGGTYNFTNNAANVNVANFTGGANDTNYEWVGFYSGTTRMGIFLWDGAWNECKVNEFCITGENAPLALDSNGTIYMRDTVDMEGNGIIDINWGASYDGSGSGLDADLLDGNDSSYFKCSLTAYAPAGSGGTYCPAGKAVIGGAQNGVVVGGASYDRVLVNPSSGSGAPTSGYMICCPTNTAFP